MFIDARQIDNHVNIASDVCIIGAGAAGITMALEFAGKGIEVVVLEGGGLIQTLRRSRSMPVRMSAYPTSHPTNLEAGIWAEARIAGVAGAAHWTPWISKCGRG